MRVKWTKQYYLRKRVITTNDEGMDIETWGNPIPINANIQPATGKVQAQIYGQELNYILNMLYDGSEALKEGDGVCVYVDSTANPDYTILSIKPWNTHKAIELKKVTNHGS